MTQCVCVCVCVCVRERERERERERDQCQPVQLSSQQISYYKACKYNRPSLISHRLLSRNPNFVPLLFLDTFSVTFRLSELQAHARFYLLLSRIPSEITQHASRGETCPNECASRRPYTAPHCARSKSEQTTVLRGKWSLSQRQTSARKSLNQRQQTSAGIQSRNSDSLC